MIISLQQTCKWPTG